MIPARRLRRRAALATWHRRLGLTAATFVLILAATGLALNHTDGLRLDERYVDADWLLRLYGIQPPTDTESFEAGTRIVTRLGDRVYLDSQQVEDGVGETMGAVSSEGLVIIAVDGELLLLTTVGERVERLGREDGVPAGIARLGLDEEGRVVVGAAQGQYRADPEFLWWTRSDPSGQAIQWSRSVPVDGALLADLQADYLARILTLERVLLDLHSGRILGPFGSWLMDGAAVLLVLLAGTGIWLWAGRRP